MHGEKSEWKNKIFKMGYIFFSRQKRFLEVKIAKRMPRINKEFLPSPSFPLFSKYFGRDVEQPTTAGYTIRCGAS